MSIKYSRISRTPNFLRLFQAAFKERFFEHASLRPYLASGLGGVADYLVIVLTVGELIESVRLAANSGLPYRVIGAGSGLLMSEVGFNGLVIVNRSSQVALIDEDSQVVADSGVELGELVNRAAEKGLGGLEWLSVIPGTVGGALVTRAYHHHHQLKSYVRAITALVFEGSQSRLLTVDDDEFERGFLERLRTDDRFTPTILAARIQFTRLSPEKILSRLRGFYHQRPNPHGAFGHCFSPELALLPAALRLRTTQLFTQAGLTVNANQPDVITLPSGAKPSTVRRALSLVQEAVWREATLKLTLRLGFAGYWPKSNANDSFL